MDDVTTLSGQLTGLFGLVVGLAVVVTGFFLGRKWLGSSMDCGIGDGNGWDSEESKAEIAADAAEKAAGRTGWL